MANSEQASIKSGMAIGYGRMCRTDDIAAADTDPFVATKEAVNFANTFNQIEKMARQGKVGLLRTVKVGRSHGIVWWVRIERHTCRDCGNRMGCRIDEASVNACAKLPDRQPLLQEGPKQRAAGLSRLTLQRAVEPRPIR
ncbi:hypothetical protein GIV19_06370 [Pseudomonas syringae]|uniref:hypothetical protein n=1 Tax=Pseudomonas syringae TaxID=317 RepID=UPI001F2188A3|nr:hypothetical protein [Pseudomonas syringae]MCF5706914.1 hypothetical protein [Pseudomonas syringae]